MPAVSGRGLGATSARAARDGACDSAGARPLIGGPADVQTQQVVGQVRRPNDQSVSVNCDRTSQLPRPSRRLRRPTPHPTPREQRTSAGWRAGSCRPMDTRPATCQPERAPAPHRRRLSLKEFGLTPAPGPQYRNELLDHRLLDQRSSDHYARPRGLLDFAEHDGPERSDEDAGEECLEERTTAHRRPPETQYSNR